ncbi:MAG: hypothetical protein CFE44_09280 [Burkholderiales bacterium PBB4]|nr:MAG: hypothetical protein CFE44_09280 [Burkholderiales bacterium PBB4]
MPSATSFLLIALVVYGFMYGVMKLAMSTKEFRSQPLEDQARARKTFKSALVFTPFALLGAYLLSGAPLEVLRWVPLALYLGLWAPALWLFWRAYSLGVRKEVRHAKGITGKPMRNPHRARGPLALLNLCVGLGVLALLVSIPSFKLPLNSWAPLLAVLSGAYTIAVQRIEKRSEA